jgi:galactose oxidase-like protein
MRSTTVLSAVLSANLTLAMLACSSEEPPTQPGTAVDPGPIAPSFAAASNSWSPKAPIPGFGVSELSVGVAPNSAGQFILYTFGATDGDGGTGFRFQAYNLATNTWTTKTQAVSSTRLNGVGKIGSRLYFSGGFEFHGGGYSNALYAYDYGGDKLIRKADLPLFTSSGVTGSIDSKLYVLPGICSGEGWPAAGYCEDPLNLKLFRYDPATNVWARRASCPHNHANGAAGVIDSKFYVAGGIYGSGADLDVYNPATNSWKTLASVPAAGQAVGAVLNHRFYVISSSASGIRLNAYDPATDTWKAKAAPPSFGSVARVLRDDKGFLVSVAPEDTELYTP